MQYRARYQLCWETLDSRWFEWLIWISMLSEVVICIHEIWVNMHMQYTLGILVCYVDGIWVRWPSFIGPFCIANASAVSFHQLSPTRTWILHGIPGACLFKWLSLCPRECYSQGTHILAPVAWMFGMISFSRRRLLIHPIFDGTIWEASSERPLRYHGRYAGLISGASRRIWRNGQISAQRSLDIVITLSSDGYLATSVASRRRLR